MKLSKSSMAFVQKAMANTEDGAGLGFQEYVESLMRRDVQPNIKNTRSRHPALTVQELEWRTRFGWVSDWPNGWHLRGIARRLATGDIAEFGKFMLMHVRQAVLNHTSDDDEFTEVWPLLQAIGIGDRLTVDSFVAVATFPMRTGHPDTRLIYNSVHKLLRAGATKPKAPKPAAGKRPAWLDGMILCLEGIFVGDPSRVARGMEQHLDGYGKAQRINPLEKIVSLEAHGLYRLAERIDPNLVADCDTRRERPWDREFHDWSSHNEPVLAPKDFGSCPKPVATAFASLKRPPWTE